MDLLLKDVTWRNGHKSQTGDIRISKGVITETSSELSSKKGELVVQLSDHEALPGLINSHDHLEMNLYPKLGNPPYRNYIEWANDIYKPKESPIREIEKIDIKDRLLWGALKNLIAGVTTVVHHNPWHRILGKSDFPVKVLKVAWAHSLAFEKRIADKFPEEKSVPFVIHVGEGVDEAAHAEIRNLNDLNLLRSNTVLIHAIAVDDVNRRVLLEKKPAIIWCPASNLFMFNQTAPVHHLKQNIDVALGSDSTLTGSRTLLDEIQVAREARLVTDDELVDMVTKIPAMIFGLPSPAFDQFAPADLIIVNKSQDHQHHPLLGLKPFDIKMMIVNGRIRMSHFRYPFLKHQFRLGEISFYSDVDVASLKRRIEKKTGTSLLQGNPLWNLIQV